MAAGHGLGLSAQADPTAQVRPEDTVRIERGPDRAPGRQGSVHRAERIAADPAVLRQVHAAGGAPP
jgi:hypothetical protein